MYSVFLAEVGLTLGLDGSAKAVIGDDDQRTAERLHCMGMQPAVKGFHISPGICAFRHLNMPVLRNCRQLLRRRVAGGS